MHTNTINVFLYEKQQTCNMIINREDHIHYLITTN